MNVLVCPHDLGIGGSQLNAIEIAARIASMGHSTTVFGRPGALVQRVEQLGLDFVISPEPGHRPSPTVMRAMAAVVKERGIDVAHGYEWPPALEAYLLATRTTGLAAVGTVMSMAVAPFLPMRLPLLVGTDQIAAAERAVGRRQVSTLEPPVDLVDNDVLVDPGVAEFRTRWGIEEASLTVVTVTRLAHEMKLEGVLVAIDEIGRLAAGMAIQLVVVGGGPAAQDVRRRAAEVNGRTGCTTVIVTGELTDPRPAYAAGDILLGMGGSSLRSMAYGKPLLVQGENGFWRRLTESSVEDFLWTGWYGIGTGKSTGPVRFAEEIAPLLHDPELRARLGDFGRRLVEARFSLDHAAEVQLKIYRLAAGSGSTQSSVIDLGRSAVRYAGYVAGRKISRLRQRVSVDDFNSRPVVANGPERPRT